MKDEATPEQMEMARRIAFAVYREQPGAHEAGYDKYIAEGGNDGDEAVQSALAAIIETTEKAAALLRKVAGPLPKGVLNGEVWVLHRCADAIESAAHLKEQSNAE